MMNNADQNPAGEVKRITIIFMALLIGQVAAGFILVEYDSLEFSGEIDFSNNSLFPIYALFTAANVLPLFILKPMLQKAIESNSLVEKLQLYRTTRIIKWALLEGTYFASIIIGNGNIIALILGGTCLLIFISSFPSKDKMVDALKLSREEADSI